MGKSLILYYTLDGNTEKIATYLSTKIEADIERIKPIKDIKTKGFLKYLVAGFEVISKKRPELIPLKIDLNNYDTIFIGSPIWASNMTPAISSLLESNLIKNKNIAFFYTFEGGAKGIEVKIKESVELNNSLLSICSFRSVNKDLNNQQQKALDWTREIIQ